MSTQPIGYFAGKPFPARNTPEHSYLPIRWAAASIGLGVLYYLTPQNKKIVFQLALPVLALPVVRRHVVAFNQKVHDPITTVELQTWMVSACHTMAYISAFFTFPLLVQIASAPTTLLGKEPKHLVQALLPHIAAGLVASIGYILMFCEKQGKDLAQQQKWLEMLDYRMNFPKELKVDSSAPFTEKFVLFITAAYPEFHLRYENTDICLAQFLPPKSKHAKLKDFFEYFEKIPAETDESWNEWVVACHIFRTLPLDLQKQLLTEFQSIINGSSAADRKKLLAVMDKNH